MAAKRRKKKFPDPSEVTDVEPVAWRNTEDLIQIANDLNDDWNYTAFSQTIRDWIRGRAISIGWSHVYFPLAYPSRTKFAGAAFVK